VPLLRVVIDGSPLSASSSGIGTYTKNLLSALAARTDIEVTVLAEASCELPPGVDRAVIRRDLSDAIGRPRARLIEHAVRLPFEVRRSRRGGAPFHNPTFHAPFGVAPPWVQTLHDVIPLVFDAADQARVRARWKRFGPRYRRATAVVAVSRFSADEGIRRLGLSPDRVHVAYNGVDPRYHPAGAGDPAPDTGRPYLLVVGEYSTRKGLPDALSIIDSLADDGYPHRLVVAGRVSRWDGDDEFERLRARCRHPERVELRGVVPDLLPLYQHAEVLLSTSRYEGFGLPAVEAMACGTPVVAFSNSAVTEVVGEGGILVDDGDTNAMASAVRLLLDDHAAASEWSARGVERSRFFTWDASAAAHVEAYRDAAGLSGR
jgi:glycosyltransferase involved in cell wall biosynthesis